MKVGTSRVESSPCSNLVDVLSIYNNHSTTISSTGQKSRVSFAVLAYQRPHLLIIDEGSNHLSMDAVDALIDAVRDFKGKENLRILLSH